MKLKEKIFKGTSFPNIYATEQGEIFKKINNNYYEVTQYTSSNGYKRVTLNRKSEYVHRIIYETFYNKITKGLVVNHKDGNKTNNISSNLEAITYSENTKHAYNTGLKKATKRKYVKVFISDTNGNILNDANSLTEAAKKIGVTQQSISASIQGEFNVKGCKIYEFDENNDFHSLVFGLITT